jgi:hypothetical protein
VVGGAYGHLTRRHAGRRRAIARRRRRTRQGGLGRPVRFRRASGGSGRLPTAPRADGDQAFTTPSSARATSRSTVTSTSSAAQRLTKKARITTGDDVPLSAAELLTRLADARPHKLIGSGYHLVVGLDREGHRDVLAGRSQRNPSPSTEFATSAITTDLAARRRASPGPATPGRTASDDCLDAGETGAQARSDMRGN